MDRYTLTVARPSEYEACYEIIEMGRTFQRKQGFVQWTETYPGRDTIRADIQNKKGYVVKADGAIAGYLCLDFDGEPAYEDIAGRWGTEGPYAVVHRMAFHNAFRGMGLMGITFRLIEAECLQNGVRTLRADTDFSNERMQHILTKHGFQKRGIVLFQGSGKLAYDKSF